MADDGMREDAMARLEKIRRDLQYLESELDALQVPPPAAPAPRPPGARRVRRGHLGRPIRPLSFLPPEGLREAAPVPALPPSPVRLQINLVPGGLRNHVNVNVPGPVPEQPEDLRAEEMQSLRTALGEARWVQFVRDWNCFAHELFSADDLIGVVHEAVSRVDYYHLLASAAKRLHVAEEKAAPVIAALAELRVPFPRTLQSHWNDLRAELEELKRQEPPPDPGGVFVTGEYER